MKVYSDINFENSLQRALSLSQGLPNGGIMPYGKLWKFGGFVWEMDRALVREGSLESLTDDDISKCCLTRGFNPLGCSRAEAEEFLDRWLTLSLQLTGSYKRRII